MINKIIFNSFSARKIFTWGKIGVGLGRQVQHGTQNQYSPQQVIGFPDNFQKIIGGHYVNAVITADKRAYTFGDGVYGLLGNGLKRNSQSTSLIVKLYQDKQQVKDISFGFYHALALTNSGQVYVWGVGAHPIYGLIERYCYSKSFNRLGLGRICQPKLTPTIIQLPQKCTNIAANFDFSVVIGESGKAYAWGKMPNNLVCTPILLKSFEAMCHKQHSAIKQIKSGSHYITILLQNGVLYSFGVNNQGGMGIRQNPYVMLDDQAIIPHKVVDINYKHQKVIDYEVGSNTLIFKTDSGKVYWSGLDTAYQPQQLNIPKDCKIFSMMAGLDCVAVKTSDGIYMVGEFLKFKRLSNTLQKSVQKQNFSEIGGKYGVRWAIQ